jgi:SNF2 family DNA or RNA helicase
VADNTIEGRMLQLQERKRELGRAAFDKQTTEQLQRMRVDNIRLLMRL